MKDVKPSKIQTSLEKQRNFKIQTQNQTQTQNQNKNQFQNQPQIKNSQLSAFSLIELSIVLIIIGLLVAGITGGASLIKSAKIRALMSEIRNYKLAVNSFYVAEGRLPGDINGDGNIYEDAAGTKYSNYTQATLPWIELYDSQINSFKPDENCDVDGGEEPESCKARPVSKFNDYVFDMHYNFHSGGFFAPYSYQQTFLVLKKNTGESYPQNLSIDTKIAKQIDEKMDDGKSLTGNMGGFCGDASNDFNTEYDDFTDPLSCSELNFKFDFM